MQDDVRRETDEGLFACMNVYVCECAYLSEWDEQKNAMKV